MEAIRRSSAVWATGRWYRNSWLHTFISTITRGDARPTARSALWLYPQLVTWFHVGFSLKQATSEWGRLVDATFCFHKVSHGRSHLGQLVPLTRWRSRCSAAICLLTGEQGGGGPVSMTFTWVVQWILQAPSAWVHARWTQHSNHTEPRRRGVFEGSRQPTGRQSPELVHPTTQRGTHPSRKQDKVYVLKSTTTLQDFR